MTNNTVVLEIPGVLFASESQSGITSAGINNITNIINRLTLQGVNLLISLGAGNFQGLIQYSQLESPRMSQDATARLISQINGIILSDVCESKNIKNKLLVDTGPFDDLAELYSPQAAEACFSRGEVVICAVGVENGLFDEDLAAALRAVELNAKVLVKVTPTDLSQYFLERDNSLLVSYEDAMIKNDFPIKGSAISFAAEYNLPIIIHSQGFTLSLNDKESVGVHLLR